MKFRAALFCSMAFFAATLSATIFGSVRGLIHDPQHRPVQGAHVTLHAFDSDFTKVISSDDAGEFRFDSIPLGEYTVRVEVPGFAPQMQKLKLGSGSDSKLHFSLEVAAGAESVQVSDLPPTVNTESSTTPRLSAGNRSQIHLGPTKPTAWP